ncbi:unnamed protein product, partial [Ixodes hexagonus]
MNAIGGDLSDPSSSPSPKEKAAWETPLMSPPDAVTSSDSSSRSHFPQLRSAMKGYKEQFPSYRAKKATTSTTSKPLWLLRRSSLCVPWSRLAAFEAVFMTVVTLLIVFIGLLLDYVRHDSPASSRACRTSGCLQALKLLDDARDRNRYV